MCHHNIMLDGVYSRARYPEKPRPIKYTQPQHGHTPAFVANDFPLPAATIAEYSRRRREEELFFEWAQQHRRINVLFWTSEDATATGPRLCCRFWWVGQSVNLPTVKFPATEPVKEKY